MAWVFYYILLFYFVVLTYACPKTSVSIQFVFQRVIRIPLSIWITHNRVSQPSFRHVLNWIWSTLTHWGRVTHICVGNLTIIVPENGLSPGRRQAIIWTNAGILLIGPLGTNFSEILIAIITFSLKKTHLKMSSAKCRPFVSASRS